MIIKNVSIEKLVQGGQALGRAEDGKIIFVWNALPGEIVEVEVTKKKKNFIEGVATGIHRSSPHRIDPQEDHFLSSSPWQIVDWAVENDWKKTIALETYQHLGKFVPPTELEIVFDDKNPLGYRNKMEFSFYTPEGGPHALGLYKRGHRYRVPVDGSLLAHPSLNKTAKNVLKWINTTSLTSRNLKTVIVRSNENGETISGLFIKDPRAFDEYPQLYKHEKGFVLYYSTHKSPASVPTELMHQEGNMVLTEKLHDRTFAYGLFSFFQVNVPIFEQALEDIRSFIKDDTEVVDFYSGVGAIGISIADKARLVTLIDNEEEAIQFASQNIEANHVTNCQAFCAASEKMTQYMAKNKTIIFDPPRSGLHPKVTQAVLEAHPKQVIYLSCNLATQARDISLLSEQYRVSFAKLYNFFPRTPHIEGLCILERK